MMLLTGSFLHWIRLAAALGLAVLAMRAPAVTREYQAALLQLVRSSDQEIAQREASARRFYGIAPAEDESRFLAQLRASYERIEGRPDLLSPIVAAKDVAGAETGPRRQIAQTVFDSFAPQLDLSFAAAVYGLVGLFVGSLSGELLAAALLPRHRLAG